MTLVGNDIVVVNELGQRLQANIACYSPWPGDPAMGPHFKGAVQGAGSDDYAFAFWNGESGPACVLVTLDGYEDQEILTTFPCNLRVTMKKKVAAVRPWRRDGVNLVDSQTGDVQKIHGVTGFSFIDDFRSGRLDKLRQFGAKVRGIGGNTIRAFGEYAEVPSVQRPRFAPSDYTDAQLRDAVTFAHDELGVRLWITALTGLTLDRAAAERQWNRCQDAGADIVEGINEPGRNGGQNGGYALSSALSMGRVPVWTRGCVDDGEDPRAAGALGTLTTLHPPRGYAQGRKSKVAYEDAVQGARDQDGNWIWLPTGIPAACGEPFRLSEGSPREIADFLALADLVGSGGVVHDVWPNSLQNCLWPTGLDDRFDAIKAVWSTPMDPSLVSANYDRDSILTGDQMGGDFYRYYVMFRGNQGVGVVTYADTSSLRANHGWRIVSRGGYQGNVVVVERP